jgi:hypothetical protein
LIMSSSTEYCFATSNILKYAVDLIIFYAVLITLTTTTFLSERRIYWNPILVMTIQLSRVLCWCYKLEIFTSKCEVYSNGILIRFLHISCVLQWHHHLWEIVSKWAIYSSRSLLRTIHLLSDSQSYHKL